MQQQNYSFIFVKKESHRDDKFPFDLASSDNVVVLSCLPNTRRQFILWRPASGWFYLEEQLNEHFMMVKQGQKPGQKTGISIQNTSTLTRGHMKIRVFTGLAGSIQSVHRKKVC